MDICLEAHKLSGEQVLILSEVRGTLQENHVLRPAVKGRRFQSKFSAVVLPTQIQVAAPLGNQRRVGPDDVDKPKEFVGIGHTAGLFVRRFQQPFTTDVPFERLIPPKPQLLAGDGFRPASQKITGILEGEEFSRRGTGKPIVQKRLLKRQADDVFYVPRGKGKQVRLVVSRS